MPVELPSELVFRWLKLLRPKTYIVGHLPWSRVLDNMLGELGYRHLIIVRDPREVLVSFLHYVIKPGHPLSGDFRYLDENDRVLFALRGGKAPVSGRNVIGLGEAFRSVLRWRESANVLLVQFADLVGEKGGGSKDRQYQAIEKICDYLEVRSDDAFVRDIQDRVFYGRARTFRKGQIGEWKRELTDDQLCAFDRECGWLLREFE